MTNYELLKANLVDSPKTWLITGAAGFIGSNLLETLLKLDQTVIGLDSFATGHRANLDEVERLVGTRRWSRFRFVEGDIRDLDTCQTACQGADYVLHQAALGSVPRSLANPIASHESNVNGGLNMLVAARDNKVKRFVFASSSSVYGDHPELPKVEEHIGNCLSPYATTKRTGELYADVFARSYGLESVGLRYFNVFGARQDPEGPYAAVIPKWVASMLRGESIFINGDGETSRDFCYVANSVQANLLAATVDNPEAINEVYNVAIHARTTLNELYAKIRERLEEADPALTIPDPTYRDFREGDVRHSEANVDKARRLLGFAPSHSIDDGLDEALSWYRADHTQALSARSA